MTSEIITLVVVFVSVILFVSMKRSMRKQGEEITKRLAEMQDAVDKTSAVLQDWQFFAGALLASQPGAYVNGQYVESGDIRMFDDGRVFYRATLRTIRGTHEKWREASVKDVADAIAATLSTPQQQTAVAVRTLTHDDAKRASVNQYLFSDAETLQYALPAGWVYVQVGPDENQVMRK